MMEGETVAGFEDVVTGEREPAFGAVQIQPSATPRDRSLLGVVVAVVSVAGLYFGRDVLIPITLAVMLSFVLSPVVNMLQRLRLSRAPAVILTVLAALGLLGLIGALIGSQAASLATNAPKYAQTIEAKVSGVQDFAVTKIASLTQVLHHRDRSPAASQQNASPRKAASTVTPADHRPPVPVQVVNDEGRR